MFEQMWVNPMETGDLNLYQFGIEDCKSGHSYGPAVWDHYLIHFVFGGKGIFQTGHSAYKIEQEQGFLIVPNQITYYQADAEDPWHYAWVGFQGSKVGELLRYAGLNANKPVFHFDQMEILKQYFQQLTQEKQLSRYLEVRTTGLLYLIISHIIKTAYVQQYQKAGISSTEHYIHKVIEFIQKNYSRELTIQTMADYLKLNRSYFGSIFRKFVGITPQEFLIGYRMAKARELMANPTLNIGDIARSVGYKDPFLFSKIFKINHGLSPMQYRKKRY